MYFEQNLHSSMDRLETILSAFTVNSIFNLHSSMDRLETNEGNIASLVIKKFTFQYG